MSESKEQVNSVITILLINTPIYIVSFSRLLYFVMDSTTGISYLQNPIQHKKYIGYDSENRYSVFLIRRK